MLELRPEQFVADVVDDNKWRLVVERSRHYVQVVAVDPEGAARGFVRLHRRHAAALADAILMAADEDRR